MAPDAVVLTADEASELSDRVYQVRCAAEDVATAIDEGAEGSELRELCDALMRAAKRDLILQTITLEKHTDTTITDQNALLQELAEIRANGYALDRQEFMSGLVCIAVPILHKKEHSQSCVAALAIQAPVTRMVEDDLLTKLPVLQKAATELAATLTE